MPPIHSGNTGDGQEDDDDDGVEFRPPLPPEDRIWRHPSEVASARANAPVPEPSTRTRRPRMLAVAVVSGFIGATLSIGLVAAVGGFRTETRIVERKVAVQPLTDDTGTQTVASIAARTEPAVASLRADHDGTIVAGSAIVLRSDGHLLTNAHLVDGADSIEVRLHGGELFTATVVGSDAETDIAVLRVDSRHLEPAVLGTVDGLEIGDDAIALGAADASGWAPEVTTGIISSLARRVRTPDGRTLHNMMIVDVRLAYGTEGGPVLDSNGAVVGITSDVQAADDEGADEADDHADFCAATPIDVASRVADQIIEHGEARHVWLGVEGTDLEPDRSRELGVSGGAAVSTVLDGSPAAAAGLADGDVIVEADGEPVDSMSDLIAVLRARQPGDEITVTVRRGDDTVTLTVLLTEKDPA